MNGPEHYAEAERLLERADAMVSENMAAATGEHKADVLAAAQVHATLAHAAATLWRTVPGDVNTGWAQALGHVRRQPPPDAWSLVP